MKGATIVLVFVTVGLVYGAQPAASTVFDSGAGGVTPGVAAGPVVLDVRADGGVTGGDDGTLLIDAGGAGASGVPIGARFTFGDPDSPVARPAFTITNADDHPHDVTLAYAGVEDGDPDGNVRFSVYDAAGTRVTSLSEEGGPAVVPEVGSGEVLFVVVVVDTDGLTPTADLSGSFSVRV